MNKDCLYCKIAVAALSLLVLITQESIADIKAATVNIDKLLLEYHVAKREISSLKTTRDQYIKVRSARQQKLNELATEIKAIYAKLKNKAMPRAERNNLNDRQDELISEYRSLAKDLGESDNREVDATKHKIAQATHKLLDEFQVVISAYARENGYHWVIDTSGTTNSQISPLIYARDAVDITDIVLAILNKDAPKDAPKDKAAPTDTTEPSGP